MVGHGWINEIRAPPRDAHCRGVRLFLAVDLSDRATALVAALARPAVNRLRWTSPEQWHVTLHFLGEVDPARLEGSEGLVAALDAVPAAMEAGERGGRVEAVLGPAVAWFPGRQVLQVPVDGLDPLAAEVSRASAGWGAAPERSFRGHLTLARTRGSARGPAALAGAAISARWPVTEVILYASVPGPGGSRYEAIHRVTLPG